MWAEGLRPESLTFLAASLAAGAQLRVLFISPHEDLLKLRHHRLTRRLQVVQWQQGQVQKPPDGPCLILCHVRNLVGTPGHVDAGLGGTKPGSAEQKRRRNFLFDEHVPLLVVVEDAHGLGHESFEISPAQERIPPLLADQSHAVALWGAPRGQRAVKEQWAELSERSNPLVVCEPTPQLALQLFEPGGWTTGDWQEGQALTKEATSEKPKRSHDKQLTLGEQAHFSDSQILALVTELPRPCLLVCGTPSETDALFSLLRGRQIPCHRYHAGLPPSERAAELVRFALPGRRAVLVATSSHGPASGLLGQASGSPEESSGLPENFGIGYGRGDLKSIAYISVPCSLAQLTQELSLLHPNQSRAEKPADIHDDSSPRTNSPEPGTPIDPGAASKNSSQDDTTTGDSATSQDAETGDDAEVPFQEEGSSEERRAVILHTPSALAKARALLEKRRPRPEVLEAIARCLLTGASGAKHREKALCTQAGLPTAGQGLRAATVLFELLADEGVIVRSDDYVRVSADAKQFRAAVDRLTERLRKLQVGDERRWVALEQFFHAKDCRVQALAKLLGEAEQPACGKCDLCAPSLLQEAREGSQSAAQEASGARETRRRAPCVQPDAPNLSAFDRRQKAGGATTSSKAALARKSQNQASSTRNRLKH